MLLGSLEGQAPPLSPPRGSELPVDTLCAVVYLLVSALQNSSPLYPRDDSSVTDLSWRPRTGQQSSAVLCACWHLSIPFPPSKPHMGYTTVMNQANVLSFISCFLWSEDSALGAGLEEEISTITSIPVFSVCSLFLKVPFQLNHEDYGIFIIPLWAVQGG